MIGIYRIKNLVNNKCYYGSAKNVNRCWSKHKSQLKHNRHENIVLQRAWDKYGEENFIFEIVELCCESELIITEQKYLNKNPEYNISKQASGGDNLSNHPNKSEIINQIRSTINGNIKLMSEEDRKRIWSRPMENNPNWKGGSSFNYCDCGKRITVNAKHCNECRDRDDMNNPFYGKKHSDETKKKLSEKRMGKYNGSQNIRFKIDDVEYNSLGEASKILNVPIPTISWRLKSKNKKFNNYK